MTSLVIGKGEIGGALFRVLSQSYGTDVYGYDIKTDDKLSCPAKVDFLHICIPYSDRFVEIVNDYIERTHPSFTVIHSSVPVGTTKKIEGVAFHSPVRGKHPNIDQGLKVYVKYLGYNPIHYHEAEVVMNYFENAGINTKMVNSTDATELMKLLELSRYGVYIAFAKEQENICKKFGLEYDTVVCDYERTRNEGIGICGMPELAQPVLYPFDKFVGGHCTVEDMELLLSQVETDQNVMVETPLLKTAHKIGKATIVWPNSNIYKSAVIGKGCSIGQFCEIGHRVKIGNNVRIGAFTFIPEGVEIEDDCFIAPKVSFSNDRHPPSNKECWGKILVKKGAVIGMGATILSGVTIGENAVIGAGSVVTKDVGAGEVWYGQAAYLRGTKEDVYKQG